MAFTFCLLAALPSLALDSGFKESHWYRLTGGRQQGLPQSKQKVDNWSWLAPDGWCIQLALTVMLWPEANGHADKVLWYQLDFGYNKEVAHRNDAIWRTAGQTFGIHLLLLTEQKCDADVFAHSAKEEIIM